MRAEVHRQVRNKSFAIGRFSIISIFFILALLRMTGFNYGLSALFGMPLTVDHLEGGAFDFINYFTAIAFLLILLVRITTLTTQWTGLIPFGILLLIYGINVILAPYADIMWLVYQSLFIGVAALMHIYSRKIVAKQHFAHLQRMASFTFWAMLLFVIFCLTQVLTQYSIAYYFAEFNDAFVHAVDDFGVMKQRFGYLLGFLLSYTLFVQRHMGVKILCLSIILLAGFGIRSFLLGAIGASLLFTSRKPVRFVATLVSSIAFIALLAPYYFHNILFDTRFYSYMNALDIIQRYPFGVGLGGYPIYSETFGNQLFARFYHVQALLDYLPASPESDYVHLFGSLGLLLGMIHLGVIVRLIFWIWKLFGQAHPIAKCFLFYFVFMTCFGISEDSMFTVYYWIFFGLTSGIISGLLRIKKMGYVR